MAFNWFRRPNNESSDTPHPNQEETPPVEEPQPEPDTTAEPDTADLLAFAKAAYKNIQQKQQSQT